MVTHVGEGEDQLYYRQEGANHGQQVAWEVTEAARSAGR